MFRSVFDSITAWAPIALLLTIGCAEAPPASETEHGHEHGGGTAITLWTEKSELFFEVPPLLAGQTSDPWPVHLTRLADFSPVTEGSLTLALRGPDGTVYTTVAEAPARPGIYTPAVNLPDPGSYDALFVLEGSQFSDRIAAGEVHVYSNPEKAPSAGEHSDAISFLKEQQWSIDFAVAQAVEREVPQALEVSGEIIPAAHRVADVATPVSGLVLANQRIPAPGDRVRTGQTLAVLSPTSQDNSFTNAKAEIEHLEREVGRLSRLYEAEAIAEKRLVEARHHLHVARAAFQAMGGSQGDGYRYAIQAPIAGVIQARHFNPGARVEAGQALFEIIDPTEVWLRLRIPARHAAKISEAQEATFTVEGSDRLYQTERLVAVGASIDRETRSLPVRLAVANLDGSLKLGQFTQARLALGGLLTGVAIPNATIQKEDGQPVAYVQVGGESFSRRALRLGADDGTYTLVEQGVKAGEYVVTTGAYQVYLASLSTNEIGDHGHAH